MEISRREFVAGVAAAGVAALGARALAQESKPAGSSAELKVAMIGPGSQGRNLLINCLKIEGICFGALCDIWPYHQKYAANILKKYDQPVNVYADYQELLAKEKGLDAVIIATPDWVHAEQASACLKAGLHVYCEKEMANNLEGAKAMVLAARQTKKLLQIGHQRRSNPRYLHAERLIHKDKILGRITHFYGQWNRERRMDLAWPKGEELDEAALKKYGYDNMDRFRNWRWYKKYSGGPMADLGSHQVDVFNWFLRARPKSVVAQGGLDYYKDREWADNCLATYEYPGADGPVRGFYQVLNTTSYGGFYEVFMGDEGSLLISEDSRRGQVFREVMAKKQTWENEAAKVESMGKEAITLNVTASLKADGKNVAQAQALEAAIAKPPHQLHLENFFDAIRKGTPLSCPPEVAYETAVTVLAANESVDKKAAVEFKDSDFKV